MIIDGVNFNDAVVRTMTAEEFEARHADIFWQDKDPDTRKKMLAKAYELICKPSKQKAKK